MRIHALVLLTAFVLPTSACDQIRDASTIAGARKEIAAQLNDPDSARFEHLRVSTITTKEGGRVQSVCGELNARNIMGGYVGFRPFAYVVERTVSAPEKRVGRSVPMWSQGTLSVAEPSACGSNHDIETVCRDGSVATDEDLLITPNIC